MAQESPSPSISLSIAEFYIKLSTVKLKIPYKVFGFPHKYLPDFLVEYKDGHKEIHETKGLPLMLWISTKLKQEAAEEYFEKLGWKYKMITKGRAAFYNNV